MKIKYLLLIITGFLWIMPVEALSTIEYNLTMDDDLTFTENNIYMIDKSDIDNTSYNFLTSVLNDKIYFNEDREVYYTKSKSLIGNKYKVTLRNKYDSSFFDRNRIVNECFFDYEYDEQAGSISFETEAPFLCDKRADEITIKLKTNLKVTSNADSISSNTYIWNVKDENFSMRVGINTPDNGADPMEDLRSDEEIEKEKALLEKEKKSKVNSSILIIGFVSLLVIILIGVLILKRKNSSLNKL